MDAIDIITDDVIKTATTEQIDSLYRKLAKELSLRTPQSSTVTINSWLLQNRNRYLKYICFRDVDGWAGTLIVNTEKSEKFVVSGKIETKNLPPGKYKSQIKHLLANEMLVKLGLQ